MTKEYYPDLGARFSKGKAQIYGEHLATLAQKHDGLTAQQVLDDATEEGSPLHEYFEWGNDKAANLYRLGQSRGLIRSIRVRVITEGDKVVSDNRAFFSYKIKRGEERPGERAGGGNGNRRYVSVEKLTNSELYQRVLNDCRSRLHDLEMMFGELAELPKVLNALKRLESELAKKSVPKTKKVAVA